MSRLVDMLRRSRADAGAASKQVARGRDASRPPARERTAGMSRAVVLDALSGRQDPHRAPRLVLLALLAMVAVAALFVYWRLGRPNGSAFSPAPSSARASQPRKSSPSPARPAVPTVSSPPAATVTQPDATRQLASANANQAAATAAPGASSTANPRHPTWPRAGIAGNGGAARREPIERRAETTQGGRAADDSRIARALRYQKAGETERAVVEYRAILEADDSNAQAHNNLGLLYQAQGLNEAAMREFRRAIAIDPSYEKARNNLGVACLGAGELDAAGAEFRRVLVSDPRNQEAMVNFALVQRAGGRSEEARETLLQALALNERNAAAHYNLALLYEDAHEVARALDHYDAYLKYASGADAARVPAVREHCQVLRQRLTSR